MSRILIQNIGPLKDIDIDLKKINVFIGPQSSGKSTLIKIICFCKWVEKRALTTLNDEMISDRKALFDLLKTFHRLNETYFGSDSFFEYNSEYVHIHYSEGQIRVYYFPDFNINRNTTFPLERKVIYVPAERNIVSALPDVSKYSEANDNFLNFFYDWFGLKRHYSESSQLDILSMGITYYFDDKNKKDVVVLKNGQKLSLQYTSSGLQSVIPLLLLLDYLGEKIFKYKRPYSFETRSNIEKAIEERGWSDGTNKDLLDQFIQSREYHYTQFFFEEPEQNLFPSTQKELIEFLLDKCYVEGRQHELFLTTHSPYVLFTINNCILGSQVQQHSEELKDIPAMKSPVDPKDVGLWAIRDGKLENLQAEDGMLRANYFDETMGNIMNDHQNMLSFFDEE